MDIKSIYFDNHTASYNHERRNEDDSQYISKSDVMDWLFKRRKTLEWYYNAMNHVTRGGGGETYGKIEMINEILKMLKDA